MYPVSSKMDRKKNRVTITGRKESTLPTPLNIPSIIRLCTMGLSPNSVRAESVTEESESIPNLHSHCKPAPITLNVSQNISNIIAKNTGIAVYLPVSILSIATERRCSLLSVHFFTEPSTTDSIKEYLISARAAFRSNPVSDSICTRQCSISSFSFSTSLRTSAMSPSLSIILDAQ